MHRSDGWCSHTVEGAQPRISDLLQEMRNEHLKGEGGTLKSRLLLKVDSHSLVLVCLQFMNVCLS